jgi:hypothetical protein
MDGRIVWASRIFRRLPDIPVIKIKATSGEFHTSSTKFLFKKKYFLAKVIDEHFLASDKIFSKRNQHNN